VTSFARTLVDQLLTADIRVQAVAALAARGLGETCDPADYTGFIAWPTLAGTCTLVHSPAAMLLISEERGREPRLVGAAPYDTAAIRARNWAVFAPAAAAA
jgi:hypothetical protein